MTGFTFWAPLLINTFIRRWTWDHPHTWNTWLFTMKKCLMGVCHDALWDGRQDGSASLSYAGGVRELREVSTRPSVLHVPTAHWNSARQVHQQRRDDAIRRLMQDTNSRLSGGVTVMLCAVNSSSKYRVSVSDVTCGLKGGTSCRKKAEQTSAWESASHTQKQTQDWSTFFCSTSSQWIPQKNLCIITSLASSGPPPSLQPITSLYSYFIIWQHNDLETCDFRFRQGLNGIKNRKHTAL